MNDSDFPVGIVFGLLISLLVANVACPGDDVSIKYIQEAQALCVPHGGVKKVEQFYSGKLVAYCEDGVELKKELGNG